MKITFLIGAVLSLAACSMQQASTTSSGAYAYGGQATTGSATNVIPIVMGCGYINEPCVAVKFCVPGTSTCTTIDHVLLDTGSYGFRVFSSALGNLNLSQTVSGLAEVAAYADGSCDWGPVKVADVYLGGQKASSIPIQVIDPTYGTIPASVSSACSFGFESNPQSVGFNAILGVGLKSNDAGTYYSCSGSSTCTTTTVATANQVSNPVSWLTDNRFNNGVMLSMSAVSSANGSSSVTGGMTLGIDGVAGTPTAGSPDGTNYATGVTVFSASTSIFFKTTYNGTTYSSSFIDSGSNFWNFPDNSITQCTDGFYCATAHSLTATPKGNLGTCTIVGTGTVTCNAVTFNIDNANTVLNFNNDSYNNVGVYYSGGFDWGMPFYYGRNIFHLINGKTSTNMGAGPAWGFTN